MIVAVINQKGGVGKSSTAVHLARWLQQKQQSVLLVDSDAQASSSTWANPLKIDAVAQTDPNELAENIPELIAGYDHAVIDGAGGLSETTRVILYYAQIALIPCQPTALDIHSSGSAVKLIKQAQRFRPDLTGATFISRAVPRTRLAREAKDVSIRLRRQRARVQKSRGLGSPRGGTGNAEPEAVVLNIGIAVEPVRRATIPRIAVPGTAAYYFCSIFVT